MSIDEVIKYFGNLHCVCIKLDIKPQNMTIWKKQGYIPFIQQFRIAELTNGALVPDKTNPAKEIRPYVTKK